MALALVLEHTKKLALRDIDLPEALGPHDVRIDIHRVGICGSDVHYYLHGSIGPFVVREPMVLGHEASGVVTEVGSQVTDLQVGDRVCMEPGVPNFQSRSTRLGMYNLDPDVRFWATPPIHGCLTKSVVHPALFTYKLPDNVSFAAGAMVEPLAVGMHAVAKAKIRPGDTAVVTGAGPIGVLNALAALAGGCSRVFVSDIQPEKLAIAAQYNNVVPVNAANERLEDVVRAATGGVGADVAFEASGSPRAVDSALKALAPGGRLVLVGMPAEPVPFDVVTAQSKEIEVQTIFRYANVFDRAVALLSSGAIAIDQLVTQVYPFEKSIEAFDFAAEGRPDSVKVQISVTE